MTKPAAADLFPTPSAPASRHGGQKFTDKYDCKTFQAYESDPENLIIPEKDHPLYDADGNTTFDPLRVAEIDRSGSFLGAVIIWSDPDREALYVIEGRGLVYDVREVNRRRLERGDEPIKIKFMRWDGDLDSAIEHVRIRNFHRKRPTVSHTGREILSLHRLGKSWTRIAEILHLEGDEANEKYLRKIAALAFCTKEVTDAVDAGKVSITKARRFSGKKLDGSEALGAEAQVELLEEMLGSPRPTRNRKKLAKGETPDWSMMRDSLVHTLAGARLHRLRSGDEKKDAGLLLAFLDRIKGRKTALDAWPALADLVHEALDPRSFEDRPPMTMSMLVQERQNGVQDQEPDA